MKWKPISSAPKDGTEILVVDEGGGVSLVCWDKEVFHYPGSRGRWTWCVPGSHQDEQGGCETVDNAIGWMNLPEATKKEIESLKELI